MNHYEALELPATAPAADIRRAYRRLVLLTHPDRTPDPAAHARYLAINAAYEVLSDPARRAAYDNPFNFTAPAPAPTEPAYNVRDRNRRHASTAHRAPGTRAEAYPHESKYLRYAPIGRTVCKALLVFSLLLGIDRIWVRTYPQEKVLSCTLYSSRKGPSYCVINTQNATFRGPCLNVGEGLEIRRTALFGQVLSLQGTDKAKHDFAPPYWDDNFIYAGAGLLFVATMSLTAAAGAWPGPASRRQVDCAMMASILAVIELWLLATY